MENWQWQTSLGYYCDISIVLTTMRSSHLKWILLSMNSFSSVDFDDITICCETEKRESTEIIIARPFPRDSWAISETLGPKVSLIFILTSGLMNSYPLT